jgi:isoleucyl-tRNA synthetase
VPIPFFLHKESGELHPRTRRADGGRGPGASSSEGIEAWFKRRRGRGTASATDAAHYEKISDTLDVWFDSGSTH